MNKNFRTGASSVTAISIIVIVVIIVGFVYFFFAPKNADENTDTTDSPVNIVDFEATPTDGGENNTENGGILVAQIFTISYTDEGYSPKNITINIGDVVDFENNSSHSFWTASDVHPTHELLPGFDSLRAYKPDEVYSYTFKQSGTWTYHNHLDPSQIGTVVVK